MSCETVELELNFVAQTALAYGVTDDEPDDPVVWLPKSECEIEGPDLLGKVCTFRVPEWLAIDNGLV